MYFISKLPSCPSTTYSNYYWYSSYSKYISHGLEYSWYSGSPTMSNTSLTMSNTSLTMSNCPTPLRPYPPPHRPCPIVQVRQVLRAARAWLSCINQYSGEFRMELAMFNCSVHIVLHLRLLMIVFILFPLLNYKRLMPSILSISVSKKVQLET